MINWGDYSFGSGRIRRLRNPITRTREGWWVRLGSVNGRPAIQRTFPASAYGSRERALQEAEEFASGMVAKFGVRISGAVSPPQDAESLRRQAGKGRVHVGTGREGVEKARALGASKGTLSKILNGKQDFYDPCYKIPNYEVSGFKNEIPESVVIQVRSHVDAFSPRWMSDDEASECVGDALLAYAAANLMETPPEYLERLVKRIIKTARLRRQSKRRMVELDGNGCVAYRDN